MAETRPRLVRYVVEVGCTEAANDLMSCGWELLCAAPVSKKSEAVFYSLGKREPEPCKILPMEE